MRITIDGLRCIGCGACVERCPKVFVLGPGNFAVVVEDLCREHKDCAVEAAGGCPQGAIGVSDEEAGRVELVCPSPHNQSLASDG